MYLSGTCLHVPQGLTLQPMALAFLLFMTVRHHNWLQAICLVRCVLRSHCLVPVLPVLAVPHLLLARVIGNNASAAKLPAHMDVSVCLRRYFMKPCRLVWRLDTYRVWAVPRESIPRCHALVFALPRTLNVSCSCLRTCDVLHVMGPGHVVSAAKHML